VATAEHSQRQPVDLEEWRRWNAASQDKALAALQTSDVANWRPFYCPLEKCDGTPHVLHERVECAERGPHRWALREADDTWYCVVPACDAHGKATGDGWVFPHGRTTQHPPKGDDWFIWLFLAGRGAGKTRAGSEWVHRVAQAYPGCHIALIAPTGDDIRDTMVEGDSGILKTARPGFVPEWEPSKKKLTWPNGSTAHGYSGEKPERLRGKQHHFAWIDEPIVIDLIEEVWSNFLLGFRLGENPQVCITTSPMNQKWLRDRIKEDGTVVHTATSYDNIHNLAPTFKKRVLAPLIGTRMGRQEVEGILLGDVEGALWQQTEIDTYRVSVMPPDLDRIVIGLDPAGTANAKSDETGIVAVGVRGEHLYVLRDASGKYSPSGWATRALRLADEIKADAIVVETTYGKDMVRSTIKQAIKDNPDLLPARIIDVDSRRGKQIRAEPISAISEQGRTHVVGELVEFEGQLTSWIPGHGASPDRLDAFVHAATDLIKTAVLASVSKTYAQLKAEQAARQQEEDVA
jgi:phage terminase large subunit-like protein